MQNTQQMIAAAYETYFLLLVNDDPRTRWCAAYALWTCSQFSAQVTPRLLQHLARETDNRVRATMLLGLGWASSTELILACTTWLGESADALVRTCAAIALANACKEKTPQSAVDVLHACLSNPAAIDALQEQMPWASQGSISVTAALALSNRSENDWPHIMWAICDCLGRLQLQDLGSISLVGLLIQRTFTPNAQKVAADSLTPLQRSLLIRLVDCDRAWDFGNVMWVFLHHGLPGQREELKAWLGNGT